MNVRHWAYVVVIEHCFGLRVPMQTLSEHMFSEAHTKHHRLAVAASVTMVGSTLTHMTDLSTNTLIHTLGAGIGELLGAFGMSPVVEHVVHMGIQAQQGGDK